MNLGAGDLEEREQLDPRNDQESEPEARGETGTGTAEPGAVLDLQYVFDHSPLAAIEWDAEFRVQRWSNRAALIFGWTAEEVLGLRFDEFPFVHPDELTRVRIGASRLLHGDARHTVRRNRNLRKDGNVVRCEWYNSVLRDDEGRLVSTCSLVHDITDREQAKDRLRQSEMRLDLALTAARMGTWTWDLETGVRRFDARCARLLGYIPDEVLGDGEFLKEHVHPEDLARVRAAHEDHVLGRSATYSEMLRLRTRDQGWRWFLDRGQVVQRDESGRPRRSSGALLDVHERHLHEASLHQEHKMEALSTLAGGMAHDFNNILSAMYGYTELALEEIPRGRTAYAHVEEVLRAAKRATRLVEQILIFGRRDNSEFSGLDLFEVVLETRDLLRATLPGTIEVFAESLTADAMIRGDHGQLLQAFLNLGTNAAHAMRNHGGTLRMLVDQVEVTREDAARKHGVEPGSYVRLLVSDDGCGMDEEVLRRAFDPFFTTKRTGEGTGLGLSVAHGIVQSHGGRITVESQAGEGSTFELSFPLLTREIEPQPAATPATPAVLDAQVSSARVLVVDDEASLAELSRRILERIGYDVAVCTSVEEALSLLESGEDFDLIVTDRTMPGKDGIELARDVRTLGQVTPLLLVSGDGARECPPDERALFAEILAKPFGADDLAGAIERILSRARESRDN